MKTIAQAGLPGLSPCDEEFLLRTLRSLSTLPRRGDDDLSAELRTKHWCRDFGGYPNSAITFLHDTVRRECRFFPSPKECFDILARWERNDKPARDRNYARNRVAMELRVRFDEAMSALSSRRLSQEEIDALPDRWKAIAAERCLLWALRDGTYVVRNSMTSPDDREDEIRRVGELREAGLL